MNNDTLKFLLVKTNEFAEKLKQENFFDLKNNGIFVNGEDTLYKEKFTNLKQLQNELIAK